MPESVFVANRGEVALRIVRAARELGLDVVVAVTRAARPLMADGGSVLTLTYYGAEKVMPNYNVMGVAKAALESASGVEAAPLFLEQMIAHHQGAIEMAETELANGKNADALALAQAVVDTQSAEIETMQDLLGQL